MAERGPKVADSLKQPTEAELEALHTVYYNASTCSIKDDVNALASNWRSGHGPLTKVNTPIFRQDGVVRQQQEAGLLLWYHCHKGEDGQAEVMAAGVIATCLAVLDNAEASIADKSLAAGLLLTLCQADDKNKEATVKGKAGQNSCCHILHSCMEPDAVPRHVVALLACLAGNASCLSVLLKALAAGVPWHCYWNLLCSSHKDHATAISAARLVQSMVAGHEARALEAAAAGLMTALLGSAKHHKSAGAVAALASCLQAMCEAATANCNRLGSLPDAIQILVDLLGPPPASIVAWEKEQFRHIISRPAHVPETTPFATAAVAGPPASAAGTVPAATSNEPADARRISQSSSTSMGSQRRLTTLSSIANKSLTPRRTSGAGIAAAGSKKDRSLRPVRSIVLPEISEASDSQAGATAAADRNLDSPNAALHSKSIIRKQTNSNNEAEQGSSGAAVRLARSTKDTKLSVNNAALQELARQAELPQPSQPLLCMNSTDLKWEGPVPEATRAAVAGVLGELVLVPALCQAVSLRLGAPRLSALLEAAMAHQDEGAGKPKKKKKASKLVLPPEREALICHICVCLKFLVAASNADCYRVAAAGSLPHLVRLVAEARNTRLRQSAQATLSQVALLSESQQFVEQAQVQEELLVQVPMKLTDQELRQLLIEFPTSKLQRLDDVVARARV